MSRIVRGIRNQCGISNAIDGTEDDILWDDLEEHSTAPITAMDEDDEMVDKHVYDDRLTEEQWRDLFGDSDNEDDFDGFQTFFCCRTDSAS